MFNVYWAEGIINQQEILIKLKRMAESDGYMGDTDFNKIIPTEEKGIVVETNKEEAPTMSVRFIEMDMAPKKSFYNEFEKMEIIKRMVETISNDSELGEELRRLFK